MTAGFRNITTSATLLIAMGAGSTAALAQTTSPAVQAATKSTAAAPVQKAPAATMSPEQANLLKMSRRISLKVEKTRLEDIVKFIQESTQAELEPMWTSDSTPGLEKDTEITINMQNQPALYVLEQVLEKAKRDYSENSWQLSGTGGIEFGPKELLNKSKRLVIYDMADLLLEIPNYPDVPQIDLNSVLQQSGQGGGSAQSPFQNVNNNQATAPDRAARLKMIQDIITGTIETSQWQDNGGEGGSIRAYNNTLIINAADYMHRQIAGYPYWKSTTTRKTSTGSRYVTLNMDTGTAQLQGITNVPVTATTGGGGGGSPTPPPPRP